MPTFRNLLSVPSSYAHFTLLPMKMEPIEGSETSALINQTPGNYPKGNLLYSVQGESLKSRTLIFSSHKVRSTVMSLCTPWNLSLGGWKNSSTSFTRNIDNRWRRVKNLTLRPIDWMRKISQIPINRMFSQFQNPSDAWEYIKSIIQWRGPN